jgi:hypothetical protein
LFVVNEERFILAWGTRVPESGISLYNPPILHPERTLLPKISGHGKLPALEKLKYRETP